MSSFTFIPRSVKKKTASSGLSGPSTSSSQQREVSSTAPVAQIPALARSRSEHVVSTDQYSSSETRGSAVDSKGKSRERILSSAEDGPRLIGAPGSNIKPAATKVPDLRELAGLVCLALSDYRIWADTNLRRKIDWAPAEDTIHEADAEFSETTSTDNKKGYIPLDYLMHHSPVFQHLNTGHPETLFVKAIRTHAVKLLDVRLVLASEETTHESQWSKENDVQTGYQVRRRTPPMQKSKSQWDNLTIYVEHIPAQFRSLPGVLKLISNLLPCTSTSFAPQIQDILFPAHHRDRPGSLPICKGFALVVLANEDDVQHMLHSYPWEITQDQSSFSTTETPNPSGLSEEASDMRRDAHKFGLRTLLKSRWEELRAEYLLYRQQLVDEINQYQEAEAPHKQMQGNLEGGAPLDRLSDSASYTTHKEEAPSTTKSATKPPAEAASQHDIVPAIYANSPFPSGCLIYARNINMETNKTTLRSLFSQSAKNIDTSSAPQLTGDGIDYVDYMKGMNNCHLRLSTPAHATQLLRYFSEHPTMQMSGLDGVGKQLSADSGSTSGPGISLELVLGKREQVYWEKVPEKVCRQAVGKALQTMRGMIATGETPHDDSSRKQKKRKRG